MRAARAIDWRRRLASKLEQWRVRLTGFSFEGVPALGSAEIEFDLPLTLICGQNGVGKSTILKAMWAALNANAAESSVTKSRKLTAGTASMRGDLEGAAFESSVEFSGPGQNILTGKIPTVHYIDGWSESRKAQEDFCEFEGVEDITNGVAGRDLTAQQLLEIGHILGREYRRATLYEVEANGIQPFFEVSHNNDIYDSRTMGSGEISALYIWWAINRVGRDEIILLEEPEAFLSAASQVAITDQIIKAVVDKKAWAVISTHSAPIISAVPKGALKFITRGANGVQVVGDKVPPILLAKLGIEKSTVAFLFVEDRAGLLLAKMMMEYKDPSLARSIEYVVKNGEAEVTAVLRSVRGTGGSIKFVGAFDGDQRGRFPADIAENSMALPGTRPIEVHFREMAQASVAELERRLGRQDLMAILSALEGEDHHDWMEQLGKALGLEPSQLFFVLFSTWAAVEENGVQLTASYNELLKILGIAEEQ